MGALLVPNDLRAERSAGEMERGAELFAGVVFGAVLLAGLVFFAGDCVAGAPLVPSTSSAVHIAAAMRGFQTFLITQSSLNPVPLSYMT